jgi:hypothetical protein
MGTKAHEEGIVVANAMRLPQLHPHNVLLFFIGIRLGSRRENNVRN